jgi:alkylation response protein AidB-like acyl-CoA dehydrogenase
MAQQSQVSEEQARAVAEESRESGWDKPSLAKELFLGRFPLDLIHPFPEPSNEEAARTEDFLTRLREFLLTVDGSVIERDAQIPDEYVKGLAELGCFGMKIPSEYGGLGLSQVAYNRALMLVSTVHASLGALLSAHQSIGVPEPLKLAGSDEQKQKFLPRCAAGAISAFLLTEPDVGSDPARLASTATPLEGGAAYELDGVKLWTTNGVVAELLVVMAAVPKGDGHRGGISAFVVEADSPGITVERRNKFMGLRGIENGLTRMHKVRVPAENLIGKEGDGLKIALTTLNAGRLSIPAICAGSAKWSLKIAREWAGERVQWGKPVGEHGAVVEKISFMAATSYALESVLELSGQMADEGRNDIRIEAALAKLWSSEMSWKIGDELLQIRGGRGYETAESLAARGERAVPVEQVVRDLRINRIFEGSSEIMRLLIAREAVDAHLSAAGDLANAKADLRQKAKAAVGASGFYAKWLPQLRVRRPGHPSTLRRALGAQAGPQHLLRDGALASRDGTEAGLPRAGCRHRRRTVRHGGDVCASGVPASRRRAPRRAGLRVGRGVLPAGHTAGGGAVRSLVDEHRRRRRAIGRQCAQGALHLGRGGDNRPVRRHRAVDRALGSR